jgi:hypothetical protein
VHAQDRLWQMESLRRLAQGRLSEVAGRKTVLLDYFARLLGLPEMRRQAIRSCSAEDLGLLRAYCAGVNAAGAAILGSPLIGIGHNAEVAWGLTNVMLDCADLIVLTVDPKRPTRYRTGGRELEMEREEVKIGLPHGKCVTLPLYRTVHGPVLTAFQPGTEAVAVLKWHGTLPKGTLEDQSLHHLLGLMRSRTAAEALSRGGEPEMAGHEPDGRRSTRAYRLARHRSSSPAPRCSRFSSPSGPASCWAMSWATIWRCTKTSSCWVSRT